MSGAEGPASVRRIDQSPFELRVEPRGETGYAVALFQALPGNGKAEPEAFVPLVRLHGDPLKAVIDQVLAALRRAGYRATDLGRGRREPFRLAEPEAVRLGVLFAAVKPLRKVTRMQAIAEQVTRLEPEELYYWFSKMTARAGGVRACLAFRILMAEE
jgi:hypothetical protein